MVNGYEDDRWSVSDYDDQWSVYTTMTSGQWAMTDEEGRRLSLTALKESIKVPLTEREVFVITKSWKTISRNMTHIGIAMFLRWATRTMTLSFVRWLRT